MFACVMCTLCTMLIIILLFVQSITSTKYNVNIIEILELRKHWNPNKCRHKRFLNNVRQEAPGVSTVLELAILYLTEEETYWIIHVLVLVRFKKNTEVENVCATRLVSNSVLICQMQLCGWFVVITNLSLVTA